MKTNSSIVNKVALATGIMLSKITPAITTIANWASAFIIGLSTSFIHSLRADSEIQTFLYPNVATEYGQWVVSHINSIGLGLDGLARVPSSRLLFILEHECAFYKISASNGVSAATREKYAKHTEDTKMTNKVIL